MRIFELTDKTTDPSRHSHQRAVMLLLLGLLSLMTIQCSGAQGEVEVESESVELATACGEFDKMAPRVTYHTPTWSWEWGPRYKKDKVLLDDHDPNKSSTDDAHASEAHKYARDADTFFRQWGGEGFGIWDGCYGSKSKEPIMTSVVHHENMTGWQDELSKVVFQDEYTTKVAVAHEWTHGVIFRTTQLNTSGQSGALHESVADVFAMVITNVIATCNDRTDSQACELGRENISGRNFAYPTLHDGHPSHMTDKVDQSDKYALAGIPNKAAYLLIKERQHEHRGVSVTGIGPEKVARIYFHALNPYYGIHTDVDFETFAKGVRRACDDIAANENLAGQTTDPISASDCDQVTNAFLAVGMLRSQAEQPPVAEADTTQICLVPDVVGQDVAVAESSLTGAGLQPVKDFRHDDSVAQNAIISQDLAAGTRLEPCQGDVVIVVSLGPTPPTQIPLPPTAVPTPDLTPKNVALNKPVTIQTNGADEPAAGVGDNPSDVTDGSLDYEPVGNGKEDGSVAWPNADYNEPIIIDVTIDLQEEYYITEIRYNMGNVDSAHVWHADSMTSPFGRTRITPGGPYQGAWTTQTGSLVTSQVEITLEKTRTEWNRDWFFIGEIEVYGIPAHLAGAQEQAAVTQESSSPPNGRWTGTVSQPGASAYTLGMSLQNCSQQAVCGQIDYPDLSCGGTLTFLDSQANQYRFREKITYGADGCADEGTITMQPNADGSWFWRWYHESYGEATATLQKTE